jgi:hypothetical protein
LESVYTGNRIVGSNPTPSARKPFAPVRRRSVKRDFSTTFPHSPSVRVRRRSLQSHKKLWEIL